MSVEFTKSQKNNSVACNGGYSFFFVKKTKTKIQELASIPVKISGTRVLTALLR